MEKFKSGHEIFDEISSFPVGSFILVLDKAHYESLIFLNALLSNRNQERPVCLLTTYQIESPFKTIKLDLQKMSLQEVSIMINKLREDSKDGIIIHNYLPHILVKEDEEIVLKMVESWYGKSIENKTTEFFTLPKGTFSVFEKKFNSLVYGSIDISIKKEENIIQQFSISRACKPEHHMREFQYVIKDNRLLIKWGNYFLETLPKEEELIINEKINYLKKNLYSLKISMGSKELHDLPIQEYLLASQLIEKRLWDIELLFPDIFDQLLKKIAIWNIEGFIKLDVVEERKPRLKEKLNLLTRIALSLPSPFLSLALLYKLKFPRAVPVDCYLALKKAAESFVQIIIKRSKDYIHIGLDFAEVEKFFQNMAGRVASIEHIKKVKEDPANKLELSDLPKLISITLLHGWGLNAKVKKESENVYTIDIKECYLCKDTESKKPVC
ncbi:MAG: hypothetical protein QXD78_02055, partial [Candidatus Bathyarchaeia archaeon]